MRVYLRKDLVKDLDTDALLVYVALRSMYHKDEEEFYVSINMLCYRLFGNNTYTRAFKDSITHGLGTLVDRHLVVVQEKISKMEYIINGQGLYFEDEFFVGIDLSYIRMVCNIDARIDRGSLVKYLLTMVGTLCNDPYKFQDVQVRRMKGLVGFMPISYIAQEAGVSEATALSYNTILEDNKIVYIYRHKHTYYDEVDERLKSVNNNYGLYENKDDIRSFGNNVTRMHGLKPQTDANYKRSMAAKYNAMLKGKQYSEEETKEILEYINSKERYDGAG